MWSREISVRKKILFWITLFWLILFLNYPLNFSQFFFHSPVWFQCVQKGATPSQPPRMLARWFTGRGTLDRSKVTLLPSLKTLVINKNRKNPLYFCRILFGKPKYAIPPCWSFYVEKIWFYFHLKREMEIWKWKSAGVLSKNSLPLHCILQSRTHFSWPLVSLLHLVLSLIKF